MSHESSDIASIWRSLAVDQFRAIYAGLPATQGEKAELFRESVSRAFYALAENLSDRTLRISTSGDASRLVTVDGDALRRLIPTLGAGASTGKSLKQPLGGIICRWLDTLALEPAALGDAFEGLYGEIPGSVVKSGTRATRDRNTRGVFYTPAALVDELCEASLGSMLQSCETPVTVASLAVLDPAMGGGRFLLVAAKKLEAKLESLDQTCDPNRRALVFETLYGVDRDALAVDVARLSLWLASGANPNLADILRQHLVHGDAIAGPARASKGEAQNIHETGGEDLDWAKSFPEVFGRPRPGFDLVIGNPPWGKVKAEYKRFLTASVDDASRMQGSELRRHMQNHPEKSLRRHATVEWNEHSSAIKCYAAKLRGRFKAEDGISGRGDADLYKYFMARCLQLIRERGAIALIIPAAFRNTEGTAALRRKYLGTGKFSFFTERTNRRRYFPIHSMFRFISFVFWQGESGGIENMVFADGKKSGVPVRIALQDLRTVADDDLLIPEVRSQGEFDVLKHLYKSFEPLGSPGVWTVRFVREVDVTNASARFVERRPQGSVNGWSYLPLFEGRMVDQFDYAAKEYVGGAGRTAEWRSLSFSEKRIRPHYFLPVKSTDTRHERYAKPRAAFCDITGHANRRTLLATVLPGGVASGNKVPTCRFEPVDDPRLHLLWVAIANSLTVDWIVRRRISTTLNFFHLYAIPFPRLDPSSAVATQLINLAASLVKIDNDDIAFGGWLKEACGHDAPAVSEVRARQEIMDEIDEIVFDLYGLEESEIALIKSDFPHLSMPGQGSQLKLRNRLYRVAANAA